MEKSEIVLKNWKFRWRFEEMDSIFVEVRSVDGENLCFIERPRSFLGCELIKVRGVLDGEVGNLLPRHYKFSRRRIPVSTKQEENLELNACVRTCTVELDENQDTCAVSSDYCLEIKEFTIKDSNESTKVTPPRREIRSPSAESPGKSAVLRLTQTENRERVEQRGVQKTISKIAEDKEALRYKLDIAQAKLVSLKADITERAPLGNIRSVVCSNCHIRGHRVNKPCTLPSCKSYFNCGILNLHKEHKAKIQEV